MRRAAEGAAISDHLKAYNESRVGRAPAGSGPGDGRRAAASSSEEFASYGSKRDYLRDWARRLAVAAGVAPTEHLVLDYANRAAGAVSDTVLARLPASSGQFLSDPGAPPGTSLDSFDARYRKTVELASGQRAVDEAITAFLDSCHDDWMQEIRRLGRH